VAVTRQLVRCRDADDAGTDHCNFHEFRGFRGSNAFYGSEKGTFPTSYIDSLLFIK
jgi:hypothetical protein